MIGRVVKAVAGRFLIVCEDGRFEETEGRGKCRREGKILVGDRVEVAHGAIERVIPRRNRLIRPAVANVDAIAVVLAPLPEPDLMLADKLLIYAASLGISVYLALNKADLFTTNWEQDLTAQYRSAVDGIFPLSAERKDGLEPFRAALNGKFVVFAGQSAVGKSSLLNALGGNSFMETGEVGERSGRGRHTTRHAEVFDLGGALIADTPGFSMLEGAELHFCLEDADLYYPEFFALSDRCRYRRCTHTHEPDCAVKAAIEAGTANASRYLRYLKLREELNASKPY